MATCRPRPQLVKSRERGLNWTFEPRQTFQLEGVICWRS